MQPSSKANLYLLFVTAMWGVTFPLIRNAVASIDPNLFVTIRYLLATLILLPFVWHLLKKSSIKLIFNGFIFGTLNSIAYIAQTMGLKTIHSSRSAFLTGLSVILVPFIAPFFSLGQIRRLDILCAIICLSGLYILTGTDLSHLNIGDEWTLLGAVAFAILIAYLQKLSIEFHDYKLLTFYQLLFTIPLALFFSINTQVSSLANSNVIIAIVFCAIFATILAFLIQTKYQKFTTAPKVALIFSLEPVFASIFGFLLNGEKINHTTLIGGLLILLSITIPSLLQLLSINFKRKPKMQEV